MSKQNSTILTVLVLILLLLVAFWAGREYEREQTLEDNVQDTLERAGDDIEEGLEETGENIDSALNR